MGALLGPRFVPKPSKKHKLRNSVQSGTNETNLDSKSARIGSAVRWLAYMYMDYGGALHILENLCPSQHTLAASLSERERENEREARRQICRIP